MLPRMKATRFAALLLFAGTLGAFAQAPGAAAPENTSQRAAARTWFVRLIPPRPTFDKDMTPEETKAMQAHYLYWKDKFEKGVCLFGGPVLDPKGVYGVVVIVAPNEDAARAIADADPSVKAGINKVAVAEMHAAFVHQR